MTRALVTGDAGFVGRHFRQHLEGAGWQVTGWDTERGTDARDLFRSGSPCDGGYFDLVVHCAAVVGGRKMIDGAPLALASNLELDAGLFQWALRAQPGRVVYFSSSAAYPVYLQDYRGLRLREDDISFRGPQSGLPDQLYGWAKLTGENLADRARQQGLKVTVVRPFSGYGEDQDAAYPFPAFTDRALARDDPFTIWGDGCQVRDFIHIDDIVAATMLMVSSGIDGPVNLGTGRAVTLRELAVLVTGAAGYSPAFRFEESAPSGVRYRVCDPSALRAFYSPGIELEEGIRRALGYRKSAVR